MSFKEINIRDVKENPVKLISNDWALLTAKNGESCNPMTVSWGGIGELWGKDVTFVFVRPQRYTKEFMEKNDYFSPTNKSQTFLETSRQPPTGHFSSTGIFVSQ